MNLLQNRVVEEALYPICGREEEDTVHVVWNCPGTRDVWRGDASSFHKCIWDRNNFQQLLRYVMLKFEKDKVELFAVVARGVWFGRNKWLSDGIFLHPNEVYNSAVLSSEEFRNSNKAQQDLADLVPSVQILVPPLWQPPLLVTMKINWDASINEKDGRVGWAW
jgi:hypothetical protein